MSSPSAIAAVTSTLRNLLTTAAHEAPELLDTTVTTQPPGIARNGNDANQLNLFLYGTSIDTAFSNAPMSGQTKNGESGLPPLALVLKYLITAYGRNNDDVNGHRLMGCSMSALHDHPILGRAEIQAALPDTDLQNQLERVRITHDALSVDDMSKLWTSFQSEYRLSTGYEVSVVLIDSTRFAKTALPVLKRGEDDRGVSAQADLTPPFPAITDIVAPNQQTSALLGDTLILSGHHLDGDTVMVRFSHPRLTSPIDITALTGGTESQISVQIPNNPADWRVGFYAVEVIINKAGEQDRRTNLLPFSLAPRIMGIAPPNPVVRNGLGRAELTLTCHPQVSADQRVALLLGDREVLANEHPLQTDTLTFVIDDAPLGSRYVRLRVDGVDSLLVDRSMTPPTFDSAMEVTIS
ncbi:MAG: DUF4255 domain-containing protein [Gammaproteobacteria bacterium]|nr:DUF4255 domain-containing protein [Gammaproteobacteria bacterium]MCF6231436.1 DUF4255 domain-containing protein [Gammaproteobacteria bacterium]